MQTAEDDVGMRVDSRGGLENFFNAGVRAAVDQNQAARAFDGESDLGEFQHAGNFGDGVDEKDAGGNFSELIDEDEMADVIEFTEMRMFGIGAIEIAHFRGQGRLGAEVRLRDLRAAETVGAVGGNVNSDAGIYFEEIFEAGGMVGMTVRNNDKVELGEIDVQGLDVAREDFGIVAGVKEDAFAIVLDERGEAPVAGELRIIAKRIVKDGDAVGSVSSAREKQEAKNAR